MTPPWFQTYLLKEIYYLTHQLQTFIFFCGSAIISWNHFKRSIYQKHCVYFHLLQPSIITSGLWFIRQSLKSIIIWEKILRSCSFTGAYLFQRTSCSNFCLKSTVLNVWKHLQLSHIFMVNVLIWQFHNSNCSYSLCIVNFFKLQGWLSEQLLSPKSSSFGVLTVLILFRGTVVYRNNCCKEDLFEAINFCKDKFFSKHYLQFHFIWREK